MLGFRMPAKERKGEEGEALLRGEGKGERAAWAALREKEREARARATEVR